MSQDVAFLAFNRGIISRLGLARADIKRLAMSAEVMVNYVCRVLGSMMLRPGLGYIGSTQGNNPARYIPFVFSVTDKALLEFTNLVLRVWIDDTPLTRPAVTTVVAGGDFPSAASLLANWVDADEAGAASAWLSAGRVTFQGTGSNAAIRTQSVVVATPGVEHALRIVTERPGMVVEVGSTAGGDDYVTESELGAGTHSLAFTPAAGNIHITFSNRSARILVLNQCTIEAAGIMTLPTPYPSADLGRIRTDQSADVVYVACKTTYQQRKLERRGSGRSWSIVLYQPADGPFLTPNTSVTTMTVSALTGSATLTASLPFFRSTHLGALFAVTSSGQTVSKSMTALNDSTTGILVTGVGEARAFTIELTGLTATGNTVVLQRSFDNATWVTVSGSSWVADTLESYNDTLDNQVIYYRLRCTVYAGGATAASLMIATGGLRGICRVTGVTSSVLCDVDILEPFGATTASEDWEEGLWSDYRGWPSSTRLYEGRLWWFGKDRIIGSVSDGFESFDQTIEGDSGPIIRNIGSGPVDSINWAVALQRLIAGGGGAEYSARSSSLDEPLTPTNFNIKKPSRQGSSAEPEALEVDSNAVYVQRGGIRVFQLAIDGETLDYGSVQLSQLCPTIGAPGIVRTAVQRQPDTRLHFVRSDGTVAMLVFDRVENVVAWFEIESPAADGLIEDVVVLPSDEGEQEDHVYYVVKRTINGATVRYLERWATEEEAIGDDISKIGDAHVVYDGAATYTITGLGHLEGEQVAVWADGTDVGSEEQDDGTLTYLYTVSGGSITLDQDEPVRQAVVGLPYEARWKSGKLVQLQQQLGDSLVDHKNIKGLGIVGANLHPRGLLFGPDFDNMNDLPSVEEGAPVDQTAMRVAYDQEPFVFPGTWSADSRLCLKSQAPRPATVLAAICDVKANR